jgi:SAM-dependent methyltransferase
MRTSARFTSVEEWLDAVPGLFHPAVAVGLDGGFQFELAGVAPFSITIEPGGARVGRGRHPSATMTVSGSAERWLEAVNASDRSLIDRFIEHGQLVPEPLDSERLKWLALTLSSERSGAEHEYRRLLVGRAEAWPGWRALWVSLLREQGLVPAHHLLDLGCGTLRAGAPLIEYLEPRHYTGVDIREEVFAEARKELAAAGIESRQPELIHCPDLRQLALGRTFDVVLGGSVLVHLDDDVLDVFLDAVHRHIAPTGAFYANVNMREHLVRHDDRMRWLGFPWVARSLDFYRETGRKHGLEIADLGALPFEGQVSDQRVIRYQKIS